MDDEKRWMVAYTKMHHERKAVERLKALGIECFAPVMREVRQWSDRKKLAERLVVSMTIFTKVNETERMLVLQDPSVSYYMMDRGSKQLAVIRDEEIYAFRRVLAESEGPVSINPNLLAPGDLVEVMSGPLAGVVGHCSMYRGKGMLSIHVEALGYASVEISVDAVKRIE